MKITAYDYVVARLLRAELRFSVPADFDITEVDLCEELVDSSADYRRWFAAELERIGKGDLLSG